MNLMRISAIKKALHFARWRGSLYETDDFVRSFTVKHWTTGGCFVRSICQNEVELARTTMEHCLLCKQNCTPVSYPAAIS